MALGSGGVDGWEGGREAGRIRIEEWVEGSGRGRGRERGKGQVKMGVVCMVGVGAGAGMSNDEATQKRKEK
jgi:hypothetical protein